VADFVTFTRQDGYPLVTRASAVSAFMPASSSGTCIWIGGSGPADFQHIKEHVDVVAKALRTKPPVYSR
jgi:hypothetical protein